MAHHPNERGQRISDYAAMPTPKTEPPPPPAPGPSLLAYRMKELEEVLDEVLRSFHERGHPGYAAVRSGWIREDRVAHWRAVLDRRPEAVKTAVADEDGIPATCPVCGSRGMPRRLAGLPCRDPWHGESLLRWARTRGYTGIVKLMEKARAERGAGWSADWGQR